MPAIIAFIQFTPSMACWNPEGGTGVRTIINHKAEGFLSNTGPDPMKNKASIQCWAIIVTPAKSHSNGVSLTGQ